MKGGVTVSLESEFIIVCVFVELEGDPALGGGGHGSDFAVIPHKGF